MERSKEVNGVIALIFQIHVDTNDCGGIHVDDRPVGRKLHVIPIDH